MAAAVAGTGFTFSTVNFPFGKLNASSNLSESRFVTHPGFLYDRAVHKLRRQSGECSLPTLPSLFKKSLFTSTMALRTSYLKGTALAAPVSSDKKKENLFTNAMAIRTPYLNATALASSVSGGEVTEPSTKTSFPSTLVPPGGSKQLSLVGAGVREKTVAFVTVKVYAVGFYAATSMLQSLQVMQNGQALETVETVLADTEEKAFRIVMAMDVPTSRFLLSLSGEVAPRLKAAGAGAAGEASLAAFEGAFKGVAITKGSTIILSYVPPTTVHVTVSPSPSSPLPLNSMAAIQSNDLWNALVDIYLGNKTVSPSLLNTIRNMSTKAL